MMYLRPYQVHDMHTYIHRVVSRSQLPPKSSYSTYLCTYKYIYTYIRIYTYAGAIVAYGIVK